MSMLTCLVVSIADIFVCKLVGYIHAFCFKHILQVCMSTKCSVRSAPEGIFLEGEIIGQQNKELCDGPGDEVVPEISTVPKHVFKTFFQVTAGDIESIWLIDDRMEPWTLLDGL